MNENYIYVEQQRYVDRRNNIYRKQKPIEELIELIQEGAGEKEIQKFLGSDLSFLGEFLAEPAEEYIVLQEYHIGDRFVDFVVLTSRSRMDVCLIEIKGANFYSFNADHYKSKNANLTNAITQIDNHCQYIQRNYDEFRKEIHRVKDEVTDGKYMKNSLLGPKCYLRVDPNKDIGIRKIVIGGVERDQYEDSEKMNQCFLNDRVELYTWNSFIRRVDEYHGHHYSG